MHQEVLSNEAKALCPYLKKFGTYYLAGGTALALQIGHRVSIDFDFFSDKKIPKTLYQQIKKKLPQKTGIQPIVNNSDELTVLANDIKITFLYYPFPLINPLVCLKGLKLAGIKELAAMKAYTIGRRGEYKDYIDLYYLLYEKHISLKKILEIAKKKYKQDFSDRLFLEQLIYMDDIDTSNLILLKKDFLTKENLKNLFQKHIKALKL